MPLSTCTTVRSAVFATQRPVCAYATAGVAAPVAKQQPGDDGGYGQHAREDDGDPSTTIHLAPPAAGPSSCPYVAQHPRGVTASRRMVIDDRAEGEEEVFVLGWAAPRVRRSTPARATSQKLSTGLLIRPVLSLIFSLRGAAGRSW